jgi:2-polyprenyl-3-methyl-5-hydroxy-6-metoxy-1,4-benzoquinol methylase
MKTEWSKETVAGAWTDANGSKERPVGDHWRTNLINPVVWGVLKYLQTGKLRGYHGYRTGIEPVIEMGIKDQREWLRNNKSGVLEWHQEVAQDASLFKGMRILDLGCGEGYLGRWLNKMGADYIGLDGSSVLINAGKSRSKDAAVGQKLKKSSKTGSTDKKASDVPKYDLFTVDIENVTELKAALSPAKGAAGSFDLIVCGILIEHLGDPGKLLSWISTNFPNAPLLLFALNPDYFVDYPGELTRHQMRDCPQLMKAHISSADDTEVDVFFRVKEQVDELLRDCRYHTAESTPLYFDGHNAPPKEPRQAIAPFHCYYARPLPPRCREKKDILAAIEQVAQSTDRTVQTWEKKILTDNFDQLELIEYRPRETVMWPHNIGGDLFYVVSGTLELQPGIGLPILFGPDSLLGDLETGDEKLSGYYIYPVVVADEPARVLRIPASVSAKLIAGASGIAPSLFRVLRDRLSIAVWEMNYRTRNQLAGSDENEKNAGMSDPVNFRDADRVARILLAASEAERRTGAASNRSPAGQRVLIDTQNIHRLARLNLKQGSQPLYRVLHLLTALGVVDGFSGTALKRNRQAMEIYKREWDRLVADSAGRFFVGNGSTVLMDKAAKDTMRILKNEDESAALQFDQQMSRAQGAYPDPQAGQEWIRKKDSIKHYIQSIDGGKAVLMPIDGGESSEEDLKKVQFLYDFNKRQSEYLPRTWVNSVRDFREKVHKLLNSKDSSAISLWEERVDRWLTFLARVNAFWFEGVPLFFYVHDQRLLRELVLDAEGFVRKRLETRAALLDAYIPNDFKDHVPTGGNCSRQEFYIRQFFEFCRCDMDANEIKGGGQLRFSGQSHGVRLAEWS